MHLQLPNMQLARCNKQQGHGVVTDLWGPSCVSGTIPSVSMWKLTELIEKLKPRMRK